MFPGLTILPVRENKCFISNRHPRSRVQTLLYLIQGQTYFKPESRTAFFSKFFSACDVRRISPSNRLFSFSELMRRISSIAPKNSAIIFSSKICCAYIFSCFNAHFFRLNHTTSHSFITPIISIKWSPKRYPQFYLSTRIREIQLKFSHFFANKTCLESLIFKYWHSK